jgi:hypothetical protein
VRILEAMGVWRGLRRPWSVGTVAMAGVGAIAWMAGLSTWLVLALGLAALSAAMVVTARAQRHSRRVPAAPAARVPSPEGEFDPDEVITQDVNSGRIWRLGDVHFLGAAEKRRLAAERPHVWRAYRARLFPLPQGSVPRVDDPPRPGVPTPGRE